MSLPHQALRAKASELRAEAVRLLESLRLLEGIRENIGLVEVVGSVDLDLMVWPDIDVYTCLRRDEGQRFLALLQWIYENSERSGYIVVRANFNDEYRRPGNPYGQGLYLGLKMLPPGASHVWKLDLWAWDEATFATKVAEHRQLATELAGADRDLILQIKEAVHSRPEYRDTLTSMDVYMFVIHRRGTTVEEFDDFVARGKSETE